MPLPNFLIIGAAKAGTTSLYDWMRQHPGVFMPALKEPPSSSTTPPAPTPPPDPHARGLRRALRRGHRNRHRRGLPALPDARPAVERIAATLPDVRLIAALRDPAERAFSVYQMNQRNQGVNEGVPFAEALEDDANLRHGYATRLARYLERFPASASASCSSRRSPAPLATTRGSSASSGSTPASSRTSPRSRTPAGCRNSAPCTGSSTTNGCAASPGAAARGGGGARPGPAREKPRQAGDDPGRAAGGVAHFREDILRTQDLIGRDLAPWLDPDKKA